MRNDMEGLVGVIVGKKWRWLSLYHEKERYVSW
jgi:hypothetical protein